MPFVVILNPAAASGRAGRSQVAIEQAFQAHGVAARFLRTGSPGHAVELAAEAAASAKAVIAVGGDGTLKEVCEGVIRSGCPVPVGIIPIGTGNDFVRMIGMPSAPAAAVAALVGAEVVRVDHGWVRWQGADTSGRSPFMNAVGIGFDAYTADRVASYKRIRGYFGYLLAVLATLRHWKGPVVQVRTQGGAPDLDFDGRLFLVTAGNGMSSGGGFLLTPNASITDGLLDVCLVEHAPISRVLQIIPFALQGTHVRAPEVHMHRARTLRIDSEHPLPIHTDGEMLAREAHHIEIEVAAGALSFLMPVRADT